MAEYDEWICAEREGRLAGGLVMLDLALRHANRPPSLIVGSCSCS